MEVYITLTVLVIGLAFLVRNEDYIKFHTQVLPREERQGRYRDRQQAMRSLTVMRIAAVQWIIFWSMQPNTA